MLKEQANEMLCRVGPGTPMGDVFRRFWLPALLSREIAEPDGAPVRLRILGEDLLAFRDTKSRVGIIRAYCSHRLAPLFFGRNEECGLRCPYHGWKFDVDGNCMETPNVPADARDIRKNVGIKYYRVTGKVGLGEKQPYGRRGLGLHGSQGQPAAFPEFRLHECSGRAGLCGALVAADQLVAGPGR